MRLLAAAIFALALAVVFAPLRHMVEAIPRPPASLFQPLVAEPKTPWTHDMDAVEQPPAIEINRWSSGDSGHYVPIAAEDTAPEVVPERPLRKPEIVYRDVPGPVVYRDVPGPVVYKTKTVKVPVRVPVPVVKHKTTVKRPTSACVANENKGLFGPNSVCGKVVTAPAQAKD